MSHFIDDIIFAFFNIRFFSISLRSDEGLIYVNVSRVDEGRDSFS